MEKIGAVNLEGKTKGRLEFLNNQLTYDFKGESVGVAGFALGNVGAKLVVDFYKKNIRFSNASSNLVNSGLSLKGAFGFSDNNSFETSIFTNNLSKNAVTYCLGKKFPELSNDLSFVDFFTRAQIKIYGKYNEGATIDAKATGSNLKIKDETFDYFESKFTYKENTLTVKPLVLKKEKSAIYFKGEISPKNDLWNFSLTSEDLDLSRFFFFQKYFGSSQTRLNLDISHNGGLSNGKGKLKTAIDGFLNSDGRREISSLSVQKTRINLTLLQT